MIDKINQKHGVTVWEVEEVLQSEPLFRKMKKGRVSGQDVYAAMAKTDGGRPLIVFFIDKKRGRALPISARDMTASERKYYEKHR